MIAIWLLPKSPTSSVVGDVMGAGAAMVDAKKQARMVGICMVESLSDAGML